MAGQPKQSGRYPIPEKNPEYTKILLKLVDGDPINKRQIFDYPEYNKNRKKIYLNKEERKDLKIKSKRLYWLQKQGLIMSEGKTNQVNYILNYKGCLKYICKNFLGFEPEENHPYTTSKRIQYLLYEYLRQLADMQQFFKLTGPNSIFNGFIVGIGLKTFKNDYFAENEPEIVHTFKKNCYWYFLSTKLTFEESIMLQTFKK